MGLYTTAVGGHISSVCMYAYFLQLHLCIEPQYMSSRYPEVGRMNELSEERYKLTSDIRRVVRDVLKTI